MVVFDDIQWGEETFLDLVEQMALLSTGAPILLLCMAGPSSPSGAPAGPSRCGSSHSRARRVGELIGIVPGVLRERIGRAAGGNPLFVREMVAMADETDGDVVVPPTLQALLAARLDQLDPAERGVLECGAVEGEVFHRGAVQALARKRPGWPRAWRHSCEGPDPAGPVVVDGEEAFASGTC